MSYLNAKMPESPAKFDWDNLDVGNNHLDHSENFFARRHYEHEKLDEMNRMEQEMANTNADLSDIEEQFGGFKIEEKDKKVTMEHSEDKENVDTQCDTNNRNIKEEPVSSPEDVKYELCDDVEQKPHLDVTAKPTLHIKKIVNIASQWSTQKQIVTKSSSVAASKGAVFKAMRPPLHADLGAVSKAMPPPPHAYLVKDIYRRKREEAESRRVEEERKKREFHSRPVPNFNASHELMVKRKEPHACTVAVTPQVLKNSKEADEKRRKRLEEWKQKNKPPKFESRPPTVLKEKPFIPQKKPLVIQQAPFNLNTEKRLVERKHYDVVKHKALEEKKKQVETEEEQRKRREEERIRELRKATTFKARPNPFKN